MPIGLACPIFRKRKHVVKILAFSQKLSLPFWKQFWRDQDFAPVTSAHFSLLSFLCQTSFSDVFLPKSLLYQPFSQMSSVFRGSFDCTQNSAAAQDEEISFCKDSRQGSSWQMEQPVSHFRGFSRRCCRQRQDIELSWDFPTVMLFGWPNMSHF